MPSIGAQSRLRCDMHPADRHPEVANLHALDVFRAALRLYRREPARVAGAALVLLGPPIALGIGSGRVLDAVRDDVFDDRVLLALVIAGIAGLLSSLGTFVYAGVLDELVGSVIRDERRPSLGEAFRALPLLRLLGADLAAVGLVGLASFLGVVPGVFAVALLCIVGPIVNIERARAFHAIARSVRLTWRHAGLTLVAVGIPVLVETAAHHALLHLRHEADVLVELAVSIPMILTIGAFVGLTEVELAYALLAREEGSRTAADVRASAPAGDGPDDASRFSSVD